MRRAIVLLLLLAACGGGGGGESNDDATRATTTSTVASTTTTTGAGAGAATTATTTATATTTTSVAATSAADATSAAPAPLAPGTYRYRQTGRATAGAQSFDSPPEGTLVADGAGGDGRQVLHRYIDPAGEPQDSTLRFGPDGIFIVETVLRQGGIEIRCVFDPPLASPAWPPAVGNTSQGHGECDSFTTEVISRITGRTPVTIDGQSYDAFVLESTITTEGQITSTTEQVDWFVAELRMSAHTESHTTGKFGQIAFESTGTSDLISARPE